MALCQPVDECVGSGSVEQLQGAARLDHRVVPSRHHLAMLGLARVAVGRDIAIGALEHHQRGRVARPGRELPDRVGARHMADQGAEFAPIGVEHERDRVGHRCTLFVLRDQQAQWMLAQQLMQHGRAGFFEMGGQVHRGLLGSGRA